MNCGKWKMTFDSAEGWAQNRIVDAVDHRNARNYAGRIARRHKCKLLSVRLATEADIEAKNNFVWDIDGA